MFPDSEIAKKIQLQRTKVGYSLLYGIEPYFKQNLLEILKTCSRVVIGFDEALNKISQRTQMDINVRFWDDRSNKVCTRYYTSTFLGSCKASHLFDAFTKSLLKLV